MLQLAVATVIREDNLPVPSAEVQASIGEPLDLPFELELLNHAQNYQRWVAETVSPYLGNRILEVGAGIGNMSRWLPVRELLILTEAEKFLLGHLERTVTQFFGNNSRVKVNTVDLRSEWWKNYEKDHLDTVISFNVLEHVEDDALALQTLCRVLKNSQARGPKTLITFVPAHQWAFGTIDQSYGHFRRYSHKDFYKLHQKVCPEASFEYQYFNVIGLPSWFLMNRILKRKEIGLGSILLFEKLLPLLRPINDLLHKVLRLPFGQSLMVIQKW